MAGTAESAKNQVKQAGRSAIQGADSPLLKALGQVGVAAIGIVYLLLGWICIQVAFGNSGESADNTGALQQVSQAPFGEVLLILMALGLAAYVLWQGIEAATGYQQLDDKKKLQKRISAGAKAVIGLALCIQSVKIAFSGSQQSSSQKQSDWTGKLLGAPAGQVLVVIVGLGLLAFAGYQIYEGVTKKFLEKVEGGNGQLVTRLGQVGFIARGVAFGILGILVIVAAFQHNPEKAGMDQALKSLGGQPFGKFLLIIVGLGLAAYGLFNVVTCRNRREG